MKMFNLSYSEVIEKIKNETNLSEEEISQKIDLKLEKLSDLISRTGAAHILANELNVKIFDNISRELKIDKLIPGMSSVSLIGKVINIYEVREYSKDNKKGKIGHLLLGDETGIIKVVLWDTKHISLIEANEITASNVLLIKNSYVKQGLNGFKELHIGSKGLIEFSDKEVTVKHNYTNGYTNSSSNGLNKAHEIKKINEINENEIVRINRNLVYIFDPRYYEACVQCNKKVENGKCLEHNSGTKKIPIINFFLDDGSGNLRVVAFRDQAMKLMNGHAKTDKEPDFNIVKNDILGTKYIIEGRVTRNNFSNDLELIANNIESTDINNQIKNLINNIEKDKFN